MAGAAGSSIAQGAPLQGGAPAAVSAGADAPAPPQTALDQPPAVLPLLTLNATEAAFAEAAVDTLIPADELTPSGSACGVAVFIDRQLAGAFGAGARSYREGPFLKGKPEHGYQLALTPRELFREGVIAVNAFSNAKFGRPFDGLEEPVRIELLTLLEKDQSGLTLGQPFFELLLALSMEGFFSDPMYGGNRDKVAWKMLGFPGLPAIYQSDIKTYHGKRYDRPAQSILDFS